ncbi:MAG: thioredoxin family protein [Candidatus Lernaella stagnicola]|nr:thioredoxin family protein [Candidatus Lernaella stagnicola]
MGIWKKLFGGDTESDVSFEQITDADFKAQLAAIDKPVMLFLWSNTCPYCRKMAHNVRSVLGRHRDRIVGLHANAGEVPAIAGALGLRGVPATAFFHRGKLVELVGGFRPEDHLEAVIATRFGLPPATD